MKSQQQSYAPFGSVASKNKRQKKIVQDPGPGSYDISFPIIMPIVQTIRKKNNNVIVKLGHIGTASFQNDEERFKVQLLPNIGPGQYSPEKNNSHKGDKYMRHRSVAVERVREYIKQKPIRKPAIEGVKQIQIGEYVEMPEPTKRPEKQKSSPEKVKGSIWSKMTEVRGKDMKIRSVSNIGPGEYEYRDKNSAADSYPSAAFKSESIRSFFDQIYFQTNQDRIAKQREEHNYKSKKVGPGNYNLDEDKKEFYKFQFFGSTEERRL